MLDDKRFDSLGARVQAMTNLSRILPGSGIDELTLVFEIDLWTEVKQYILYFCLLQSGPIN